MRNRDKYKNLGRQVASFAVLTVFLILAVGSVDTDVDTQQVQSEDPSYMLSADQLYSEYNNNEVAADAKYKGEVVVVVGIVQDIGKDILGNACVVIGGSGFLDGVQCTFAEGEESSIASLSKGQRVQVKGEVAGKMGNVLLEKCRLLHE